MYRYVSDFALSQCTIENAEIHWSSGVFLSTKLLLEAVLSAVAELLILLKWYSEHVLVTSVS